MHKSWIVLKMNYSQTHTNNFIKIFKTHEILQISNVGTATKISKFLGVKLYSCMYGKHALDLRDPRLDCMH